MVLINYDLSGRLQSKAVIQSMERISPDMSYELTAN